jgi:hypothetical protein
MPGGECACSLDEFGRLMDEDDACLEHEGLEDPLVSGERRGVRLPGRSAEFTAPCLEHDDSNIVVSTGCERVCEQGPVAIGLEIGRDAPHPVGDG